MADLNLFGGVACSKRMAARCATAKCKKCTCDCGGVNHGKLVVPIKKVSKKRTYTEALLLENGVMIGRLVYDPPIHVRDGEEVEVKFTIKL